MHFQDHFSKQAREYARFRPCYPRRLFAYLASVAPRQSIAWDCGTGSGQAAVELARHFQCVVASDASARQIANAFRRTHVTYLVGHAEAPPLSSQVVDLVTVAQAIHWFELGTFYREVSRLLRPGGVLAAWTYHLPQIGPGIDRMLATFYYDVLGSYWPPRMRLIDERYRTLPFPFEEFSPPEFTAGATWDLHDLLGFLNSWSAVQKFMETKGYHPLDQVREQLNTEWGEADRKRRIRWPLCFRIGRWVEDGVAPQALRGHETPS